jgi:hypothetical protein
MKHASVHSKSPRQDTSLSQHRPVTGPNGIALAPPTYGIDFVDRQQSTGIGMTIQRQTREDSSIPERQQENRTGLPDHLKAGIETLSGLSLDDVHVHYNSAKPAALQALAYTQGADIHVGPGQEQYLPHEAWHVVQQKQGRVKPTFQLKGEQVNDDDRLEHEADVMKAKLTRQMSAAVPDGHIEVVARPNENTATQLETRSLAQKASMDFSPLLTVQPSLASPIQRNGAQHGNVIQRERWGGKDWKTLKKRKGGVLVFTDQNEAERALKAQFTEDEQKFLKDGDWKSCAEKAMDKEFGGIEQAFKFAQGLVEAGRSQKAAADRRKQIEEDGLFNAIDDLNLNEELATATLKKGVNMYASGALNAGLGQIYPVADVNDAVDELEGYEGSIDGTNGNVEITDVHKVSDKGDKMSIDRLSQYQANINMKVYTKKKQVHIDANSL